MTRLGIKAEQIQEGAPQMLAEIAVSAGTASESVLIFVGINEDGKPYLALLDGKVYAAKVADGNGEVEVTAATLTLIDLPARQR